MSEFKFACPVCGQHITADSAAAGTELNCPTCFRKIVVPQGPASSDAKFILSASEANKPRPPQAIPKLTEPAPEPKSKRGLVWVVSAAAFVVLAAGAGVMFRAKLFMNSRIPVPQTNVTVQTLVPEEPPHGGIGLGAWNTTVEYSNVIVSQGTKTLYQSRFLSNAPAWERLRGIWIATNGVLRQTTISENCRTVLASNDWSNYTLQLRARKLAGREGFLVMFNVADDRNWTWWNIGGWNNSRSALEHRVNGARKDLGKSVRGQIETGRWYDVRVELAGSRIRCYLDDTLIEEAHYNNANSASAVGQSPAPVETDEALTSSITGNGLWALDLTAMSFPTTNATGRAHGETFLCERAVLQGGVLHLRQGKNWPPDEGFSIYLPEQKNAELKDKSVNVTPSTPNPPRVMLRWKEGEEPRTKSYRRGYAMKLEFGEPASNRITGRIYLCLPDDAKSWVAGTFDAELRAPSRPRAHEGGDEE